MSDLESMMNEFRALRIQVIGRSADWTHIRFISTRPYQIENNVQTVEQQRSTRPTDSPPMVDFKVEDGAVRFKFGNEWREVPPERWAWKPKPTSYKRCHRCSFIDTCGHVDYDAHPDRYYDFTVWVPELLCTIESMHSLGLSSTRRIRASSSRSGKKAAGTTLSRQLPAELFSCICMSTESVKVAGSFRLVCRYWDSQCRGYAWESVNLRFEESRMADLLRFKLDPAWKRTIQTVKEITHIPVYNNRTKVPWLHLLDPTWKWGTTDILNIVGPFPGLRTLHTVHFALPRKPSSLSSRRITRLTLQNVNFLRFEDTACLVSDLPNLEDLMLWTVEWESLSTRPPRRPRTDRNKLRNARFIDCRITGVESPSFAFAVFTLFLNVYSASSQSFLSEDTLAVLGAALQSVRSTLQGTSRMELTKDTKTGVNGLALDTIIDMRTQVEPAENDVFIFIDLDHDEAVFVDEDSDMWSSLNTAIGLLQRCPKILLGFHSRETMRRFSSTVVDKKLTALSRRGDVHFAIAQVEDRVGARIPHCKYWYEASLESDQLRGEGTINVWEMDFDQE